MLKTPYLFIALFGVLFTFVSCSSTDNADGNSSSEENGSQDTKSESSDTDGVQKSEELPLVIGSFSEFPDGIDGCACYFSQYKTALESGSYIFVTNYESLAYMFLNDKMVQFKLIGTTESKDGKLIEKWSNENYTLTKKTSESGQLDETWQHIGIISIKPKNGPAVETTVIGECGC